MTLPLRMDPKLREYATAKQAELMDLLEIHKSATKVAEIKGVNKSYVTGTLRSLKKRAAQLGYSPDHDMTHPVPDGFRVKGVSTFYGRDGVARGQWVKSSEDRARLDALLKEAAEAMAEEMPRLAPLAAPAETLAHLANLYILTDAHVGMMAWREEGGADWDLKIAERTLMGVFEQMVSASPAAKVGVLCQLGDFLHADGLIPITPTSHHVLDADGRFSKVVQVAIRLLRRIIDLMLMKHAEVVVIMAEGNHDMASSVWLRLMFAALYEDEPRVRVNDSELPYYVYQHGKTMLAFHHGHMKKPDQLPGVIAAQFPEVWGDTTKRYAHMGHQHHEYTKEHPGIRVTQHPTLAARDAYAARGGWMAERQASALTYHDQHGKVGEVVVTPEMLN